MDIRNLIDYLPFTYKDRDTYKVGGKGILERFLNICGDYLSDVVVPDIDNILDVIDVENTKDIYLNYLWEFLGELPFVYYTIIDKDKWDANYNPFDGINEYNHKKSLWELQKQSSIVVPEHKIRECLKYAITMLSTKGTELFFKTLFKIYGLECTIVDPIVSTYKGEYNGFIYNEDNLEITPTFDYNDSIDGGIPNFDTDMSFDTMISYCRTCIGVDVLIGIPEGEYDLYDSVLRGLDNPEQVEDYKNYEQFCKSVALVLDKYLPFNVKVNNLQVNHIN